MLHVHFTQVSNICQPTFALQDEKNFHLFLYNLPNFHFLQTRCRRGIIKEKTLREGVTDDLYQKEESPPLSGPVP